MWYTFVPNHFKKDSKNIYARDIVRVYEEKDTNYTVSIILFLVLLEVFIIIYTFF